MVSGNKRGHNLGTFSWLWQELCPPDPLIGRYTDIALVPLLHACKNGYGQQKDKDFLKIIHHACMCVCVCVCACMRACVCVKLQALVYDILPSTTAVFSYAIGSIKLSANKQFFVGAQTVVGLLQTTQINDDELMLNVLRCHLTY